MTELAQTYAAIIKSEKQDDGTLKVYGKATDDSIDIDKQICDETWLKRAMPDWFTTGGNIREQHSNIAAGVATDYEWKADGHYITALVVDPVSVKKVESGVLKGFSIGIRSPRVIRDEKAANGRIIDGQIVEVSLVDRPANPNAKLMLAKAAESGELMAVPQLEIPTPADLAKRAGVAPDAEIIKDAEPETAEVVEVVEPAAEPAAEDVPAAAAPAAETTEEAVPVDEAVELVNAAKGAVATLLKFDQATYDAACNALADLIIVEATQMKGGSDERDSIKELLHAVKHLYHWYDGEVENGEVAGVVATEDGDLSSDLDMGIYMAAKSADPEADAPVETPAEPAAEDAAESEAVKSLAVDDAAVADIITKAVAAARETIESDVAVLKTALEAAEQKAATLETDLDMARKAAASGGPKRAALTPSEPNADLLQKAASYITKAQQTNDPVLAQGYRELANDLSRKARKGRNA